MAWMDDIAVCGTEFNNLSRTLDVVLEQSEPVSFNKAADECMHFDVSIK